MMTERSPLAIVRHRLSSRACAALEQILTAIYPFRKFTAKEKRDHVKSAVTCNTARWRFHFALKALQLVIFAFASAFEASQLPGRYSRPISDCMGIVLQDVQVTV
jgi:hypothetical protein